MENKNYFLSVLDFNSFRSELKTRMSREKLKLLFMMRIVDWRAIFRAVGFISKMFSGSHENLNAGIERAEAFGIHV